VKDLEKDDYGIYVNAPNYESVRADIVLNYELYYDMYVKRKKISNKLLDGFCSIFTIR